MANRRDYYYRQKVTESELDAGFDGLENADRAMMSDHELYGIVEGLIVSQHAGTPDLTVDVAAGIAYSRQGERIQVPALQNVDVSVDSNSLTTDVSSPGNSKIVSVFLEFDVALSDPRLDGNSATVFHQRDESFTVVVVQGAEAVSPVPPSLNANRVLLADITRTFGDTQILNAVISPDPTDLADATGRREDLIHVDATPVALREVVLRGALTSLLTALNDHVTGSANQHDAADVTAGAQSVSGETLAAGTVEAQLVELLTDKLEKSAPLLNMPLGPVATTRRQLILETANVDSSIQLRIYATSLDASLTLDLFPGIEIVSNASWDGGPDVWSSDDDGERSSLMRFNHNGFSILSKFSNTVPWGDDSWDGTSGSDQGMFSIPIFNNATLIAENGRFQIVNPTTGVSNLAQSSTPDRNTLYAKNIVKAWGAITIGTASIGTVDGFNVQTPSFSASEAIDITFRNALDDAFYSVVANADSASGVTGSADNFEEIINKTTTGFRLIRRNLSDGSLKARNADASNVSFIVLGTET